MRYINSGFTYLHLRTLQSTLKTKELHSFRPISLSCDLLHASLLSLLVSVVVLGLGVSSRTNFESLALKVKSLLTTLLLVIVCSFFSLYCPLLMK